MLGLRILLGLTLGAMAAGYFCLAMFARGFRRSFGASPKAALLVWAPFPAMALLLASLVFATSLSLLHAAGAVALAAAALCAWQIATDGATVLWLALAWLALWLVFYAHAAWGLFTPAT